MRKNIWKIGLLSLAGSMFFIGISSFATVPKNVDLNKVKTTRLSRNNGERKSLGLNAYTGCMLLDASSEKWAEYLQGINLTTHQRLAGDGYYNYRSIKSWFAGLGIGFHDESGTMFSENIGYGYYKCAKSDCTDALIKAIKSTRTFFMNEKYKKSQPHYGSIVSKTFDSVGLGISLRGNMYYLVSHYGKNVMKTNSGTVDKQ